MIKRGNTRKDGRDKTVWNQSSWLKGMASMTRREEAIWECAVECVTSRKNGVCKGKQFGRPVCNQCACYVRNYVNDNSNNVDLYMMQAEKEAEKRIAKEKYLKHFTRGLDIKIWILKILIGIFIAFCLVVWYRANLLDWLLPWTWFR